MSKSESFKQESPKLNSSRLKFSKKELSKQEVSKQEVSKLSEPIFKKISHIGIVVKDIYSVINDYWEKYGIGPWSLYKCNPENVLDITVLNKKTNTNFIIALCFLDNTGIELIQPLDDKNIYYDFIKKYGENLHHIGYEVNNYEETIRFFQNLNIDILMSGNFLGKNKFAYFNSIKDFKHIIDISYSEQNFFKLEKFNDIISYVSEPKPIEIYPNKLSKLKQVNPVFKKITQISCITKNVDNTIKKLNDIYKIGPWRIWEFSSKTVFDMTVWGKKQDYSMRLALAKIDNIEYELIQPRDNKSLYYEFLNKNGEGFQHLAYEVENFTDVMKHMERIGVKVSMSGVWEGKHKWVYLTTENDLKHIAELNHTAPGYVYPKPENYPPL